MITIGRESESYQLGSSLQLISCTVSGWAGGTIPPEKSLMAVLN
ncbi:hypothetical protein AVDCRST_MAG92-598 [uncultured Coleofasciculus sp.]|uniref:Uncharacterized protein n=1 Tax=uncultured Coleofasciculus sp. TaxID=1267456 RepID=A0A6J4HDH6_9CYAN|nr:hypothetical protein AVDCRST_MAG92-598 [uncultured Coleofasciculus sp.]